MRWRLLDLSDLEEQLESTDMEGLVLSPIESCAPIPTEMAADTEDRYGILSRYCKRIRAETTADVRVRQQARISFFCYPDKPPTHPIWKEFESSTAPRSDHVHKICWDIRQALEGFARRSGCSLIINPSARLPELDAKAHGVRLGLLADFLGSMPDDLVVVACSSTAEKDVFTAVGDWFYSEAHIRKQGEGWQHTVFSWHAPTTLGKVREFDAKLDRILKEQGVSPADSRRAAMDKAREAQRSIG
jgi:hypothetical protein